MNTRGIVAEQFASAVDYVRRCGVQERDVLGRLERSGNLYGRQEPRDGSLDYRQSPSRSHGSQGIFN